MDEHFQALLETTWATEFRKKVRWVFQSIPFSIRLWGQEATFKKAEEKLMEAYLDSLMNLHKEGRLLKELEERESLLGDESAEEDDLEEEDK